MKKSLIAFAVSLAAVVALAGPYRVYVTGTSQMVIPPRVKNAVAWAAATAYAQGSVVSVNNSFYWAIVGGTSTNAFPGGAEVVEDGTVTWRLVPKGPRKGFLIINDGTNVVYASYGNPAVTNAGARLNANGGSWDDNGENVQQSAFYAISLGPTNRVTAQEW